jgi:hypothetical protein
MMPEQDNEPPADPNIASVEENLCGALFGFHKKAMDLVRQSALDDEKLTLVADRINTLLDDISDEVKRTKDWKVAARLEAAYDDVNRLVDELSSSDKGGKEC